MQLIPETDSSVHILESMSTLNENPVNDDIENIKKDIFNAHKVKEVGIHNDSIMLIENGLVTNKIESDNLSNDQEEEINKNNANENSFSPNNDIVEKLSSKINSSCHEDETTDIEITNISNDLNERTNNILCEDENNTTLDKNVRLVTDVVAEAASFHSSTNNKDIEIDSLTKCSKSSSQCQHSVLLDSDSLEHASAIISSNDEKNNTSTLIQMKVVEACEEKNNCSTSVEISTVKACEETNDTIEACEAINNTSTLVLENTVEANKYKNLTSFEINTVDACEEKDNTSTSVEIITIENCEENDNTSTSADTVEACDKEHNVVINSHDIKNNDLNGTKHDEFMLENNVITEGNMTSKENNDKTAVNNETITIERVVNCTPIEDLKKTVYEKEETSNEIFAVEANTDITDEKNTNDEATPALIVKPETLEGNKHSKLMHDICTPSLENVPVKDCIEKAVKQCTPTNKYLCPANTAETQDILMEEQKNSFSTFEEKNVFIPPNRTEDCIIQDSYNGYHIIDSKKDFDKSLMDIDGTVNDNETNIDCTNKSDIVEGDVMEINESQKLNENKTSCLVEADNIESGDSSLEIGIDENDVEMVDVDLVVPNQIEKTSDINNMVSSEFKSTQNNKTVSNEDVSESNDLEVVEIASTVENKNIQEIRGVQNESENYSSQNASDINEKSKNYDIMLLKDESTSVIKNKPDNTVPSASITTHNNKTIKNEDISKSNDVDVVELKSTVQTRNICQDISGIQREDENSSNQNSFELNAKSKTDVLTSVIENKQENTITVSVMQELNINKDLNNRDCIVDKLVTVQENIEIIDEDDVKIVETEKSLEIKTNKLEEKESCLDNNHSPLPVVCKLSNTLNILSDDEDESTKEEAKEQSVIPDEKQCINLDDDDDIMFIEDSNSKEDVLDTNKVDDAENIKESTPTGQLSTEVERTEKELTPQSEELSPEIKDVSPSSLKDNNINMADDSKASEKPIENQNENLEQKSLLPENFLKTAKKNLADMTRDELEDFCIRKIVESIVDRSNLTEIKTKMQRLTKAIEDYRKKAMSVAKQNRDLQVIVKSVQEEQKKQKTINPLMITRSVGMQVLMVDKVDHKKKGPQLQSAYGVSVRPVRQTQVPPKNAKSAPSIPVPRLVPASSPAKTPPVTVPVKIANNTVTPKTQITPVQKLPEKRTHSRMQAASTNSNIQNSVTVDLTDDEPPAKINNKNSPLVPPVRVVAPQNLMGQPRAFGQNLNSPRKVYIPISGPQAQNTGIRPGQTFMLKTVPSPGPRNRLPAMPRMQQNPTRMNKPVQNRHPAPLPDAMKQYTPLTWKPLPPAPDLKLSKVENGIVISWKIDGYPDGDYETIASYQLYAYQETASPPSTALWKKIGDVKALPLPMACTLTQFMAGFKYYFAVRAVDIRSRLGPFSLPGSILLLHKM